jgi:putative ABC transport system permease protein
VTSNIKEACRDQRGLPWLEQLLQDVRFGLRTLAKGPGFAIVATTILAVGIGANTALFSMVDKLVVSPIPGRESHRLVHIQEVNLTWNRAEGVSPPVFAELARQKDIFTSIAAVGGSWLVLPGREFPETIYGTEASPGIFELLGVRPLMGRVFRSDEGAPGQDQVLVISHGFWQQHFGADPDIVGKTVTLSDKSWTIIGVMPPHFQFPRGDQYCRFWKPHTFGVDEYNEPRQRIARNWDVVTRLQPRVSLSQVQAVLDVLSERLGQDSPDTNAKYAIRARPARLMFASEEIRRTLWSLLVAVALVLVIACVNTANLLLARSEARRKELAVRMAMGAGRGRIIRQLLTENGLLACAGGFFGLLIATGGTHFLGSLVPGTLPRMDDLGVDWSMFGCTAALSLLVGLGLGLVPVWQASQVSLGGGLQESGTALSATVGRRRIQHTLVVCEIALTMVLLAAAGLLIESVAKVLRVNPGYDPKGLVWVMFHYPSNLRGQSGPQEDWSEVSARQVAWNKALRERLRSLPGVESAAFLGMGGGWYYKVEGRKEVVEVRWNPVEVGDDNCFRTLRTPLVAGRFFEEADAVRKAKTILVNQELARLAWPGESPLGKRIAHAEGDDWLQVVGVVGNIKDWGLDKPPVPTFYVPYQRSLDASPVFMVRVTGDPASLTKPLRDIARDVAPGAMAPSIAFVEQELYASTQLRRTYMWSLNVFGLIGLSLSAIGLYGLLTFSVVQRTREIGIRMALGAEKRDILKMVLGQGGQLLAIGLIVGLAAALGSTHLLRSLLFETSPANPLVLATAMVVLFLVGWVACYLPARRAALVDPIVALKYE